MKSCMIPSCSRSMTHAWCAANSANEILTSYSNSLWRIHIHNAHLYLGYRYPAHCRILGKLAPYPVIITTSAAPYDPHDHFRPGMHGGIIHMLRHDELLIHQVAGDTFPSPEYTTAPHADWEDTVQSHDRPVRHVGATSPSRPRTVESYPRPVPCPATPSDKSPDKMSRRAAASVDDENEDNDIDQDFEVEQDDGNRRQIRHQYRELMQSMHENREDMLSTRSNKLTDTLQAANQLFSEVSKPREAALDAQLLVLATNLGKEKANQLQADMTIFEPTSFAEDLLSFMGINRLENPDSDSEEEGCAKGYLGADAWKKLGTEADKYFKRTPTFHFMLGSFKTEPPVVRQKIDRQKRTSKVAEKSVMPAQLKRMEESHQEATEKEVERILGFLQSYFNEDPDTPISFFDFVVDPNSFPRTVENIFHVSFIIRDGFARIKLDHDKLPVIEPISQDSESQIDKDNQPRYQGVICLSHQDWREIVESFEITEPMIPPPP